MLFIWTYVSNLFVGKSKNLNQFNHFSVFAELFFGYLSSSFTYLSIGRLNDTKMSMSTRESILQLADTLIRDKGYNAFSFNDISKSIGIKTASVHYYFPSKTDLGVAIVKEHIERVKALKATVKDHDPVTKLERFLSIYTKVKSENKVCIVGSLATDLQTVDEEIKVELKALTKLILEWVTEIVQEGRTLRVFAFEGLARTKALMIITNMLASVQLTRLTDDPNDFETIKSTLLSELLVKNEN